MEILNMMMTLLSLPQSMRVDLFCGYENNIEIVIPWKCDISFDGTIKYNAFYDYTRFTLFQHELKQSRKIGTVGGNTTLWNQKPVEPPQGFLNMVISPKGDTTLPVVPGNKYPIIKNLPDLKGYDILKTIMSMFGLFGNYKEEGIELYSIDDFYAKKEGAVDWTKKVITGKNIDTFSFSLGDYAQKNWLKYKHDDTVIVDADDFIQSDNESLESEKTLYEMKFAATDNYYYQYNVSEDPIPMAYFPVYIFEEGATEYKKNKIEPRIVFIDEKIIARFPSDLFFSELISSYYENY